MSDITHHDGDDGFHEINLSGKQLVFAFMLATLLLVATFLMGVKIGRDVKSDRVSAADTGDTIALATPPAAAEPSQPAASSGGPPAAEPPAPAQEPDDELSYAKRLQAESAPTEKLKPQGPVAEAPAPAPAPKAQEPSKPAPAPAAAGRAGSWIVQVISLQDRNAAAGIAKRLTGKGYPAFVVDPAPGSPRLYRVQVGGYAERTEAEQAARRLEKDEQYKPLVRSR